MSAPLDVTVTGMNLNSFGLVSNFGAISGVGLNTFGFLVPCDAIWTPACPSITTTWVSCGANSGNIETCVD